MVKFKPTYLYIKRHKITGLLYFGKTTRSETFLLESYKGSGSYWKAHLKIHGAEHVETLWYNLFTNKEDLLEFALFFTEVEDIVNATDSNGKKIWANEKPENGLDGGSVAGRITSEKTKEKLRNRPAASVKTRNLISLAKTGSKHTEETLAKMRGRHWSPLAKENKSKSQSQLMQLLTPSERKKYGKALKGKPWPEPRRDAYLAKKLNTTISKEVQ